MKATLLFLTGLVLLLVLETSAEKVIYVNLIVHQNNSITEDDVIITDGRATQYHKTPGDYKIEVRNTGGTVLWSQDVEIAFIDESGYCSSSYFSYKIPYQDTMKTLVMLHNKKEIYTKDVTGCNHNLKCDNAETYFSCSNDCPLNQKDGVCMSKSDGVCDPDCYAGVDPDCAKKPDAGLVQYLPYAALPMILVIAYAAHRRREEKKIEKQRREFEQWKAEREAASPPRRTP